MGELRACRQLITREMDAVSLGNYSNFIETLNLGLNIPIYLQKYKDSNASAELNSLKYTQKLIDIRIGFLQNNKLESERDCKPTSELPILTLDELLNKELALSYYLDYLSILNLQHYVIFYLTARGEFQFIHLPYYSHNILMVNALFHLMNRMEGNSCPVLGRIAIKQKGHPRRCCQNVTR